MDSAERLVPLPAGSESEAEAKYRTLVETLPLVVYIDALDGVSSNLYTSPQSVELFGYTPEEWLVDAELFANVLHPDDRARVLDEHVRANGGGESMRIEYRLLARNGRVVWVRDESVVVRDERGRPLFRQGFLLDLTERKRTERALREAERSYRSLVEQAPLAIYTNTPDGRLAYMSSQIEDILGYTAAELTADPSILWRLVHPDDHDLLRSATDRALEAESDFSLEYRLVGRDGTPVWVLDQTSPTFGADGKTLYRQGFLADITAEKRRDEALALAKSSSEAPSTTRRSGSRSSRWRVAGSASTRRSATSSATHPRSCSDSPFRTSRTPTTSRRTSRTAGGCSRARLGGTRWKSATSTVRAGSSARISPSRSSGTPRAARATSPDRSRT